MDSQNFINEIESRLKISTLPDVVKEKIIIGITKNFISRVLISLAGTLSEDEVAELSKSIEGGSAGEAIEKMIEAHPELDGEIGKVVEEIITEFLSDQKTP